VGPEQDATALGLSIDGVSLQAEGRPFPQRDAAACFEAQALANLLLVSGDA
jgi:hypothetical protein